MNFSLSTITDPTVLTHTVAVRRETWRALNGVRRKQKAQAGAGDMIRVSDPSAGVTVCLRSTIVSD